MWVRGTLNRFILICMLYIYTRVCGDNVFFFFRLYLVYNNNNSFRRSLFFFFYTREDRCISHDPGSAKRKHRTYMISSIPMYRNSRFLCSRVRKTISENSRAIVAASILDNYYLSPTTRAHGVVMIAGDYRT